MRALGFLPILKNKFFKENLQKPHSQCQPFERRQNCIDCFSIALATGRPKFAVVAFEGIQVK